MGIGVSNGNVGLASDPDVRLLLPADDIEAPEVTILIPVVNEELTTAGLLFTIIGLPTFCFTLLLHATEARYGGNNDVRH